MSEEICDNPGDSARNAGVEKVIEVGRDPKTGRWIPGYGGGGGQYKKGKRHRASQLVQALIDGEAEGIARKVLEGALAGDQQLLRLAIDRLAPAKKSVPVQIELPEVNSLDDAKRNIALIFRAQADGELSADEAKGLIETLEAYLQVANYADLAERVAKLSEERA